MATLQILNSLATIFIMILPGLFLKKRHIIDEHQTKGISAILVNITWPCLVIDAMQISYTKEALQSCLYIFLLTGLILLCAFLIGAVMIKVFRLKSSQGGVLAFMLIFGNTGFIGIPIISILYGKEAVFYASMVELVNDVLIFTIGIMLIQFSAGKSLRMNLREFFSPGLIGIIIGFLLFLTNTMLPGFLGDAVGMIGAATTPLSMFVIGSQLGEIRFKELVGDKHIYIACFAKLLIIPAIALLIVRVFFGDASLLAAVVILSAAMPAAACTTIFSQQYGADVSFATKGVLLSTVLCIITVPLFAILLS